MSREFSKIKLVFVVRSTNQTKIMDAKEQAKYKVQLYELVSMFVRAYQPRYYVQYRGEIEDLVSEFYLEFMTPKSRVQGQEQTLLDKFNPAITTLPYLVKVSVTRMLIDRSRSDKREVRYQELYDEYGDLVLANFNLVDEQDETIDNFELDDEEVLLYKKAWRLRTEEQRTAIIENFEQVKGIINPSVREFLLKVIGKGNDFTVRLTTGEELKVFQVTDKSIQLIHTDTAEIRTYNKVTGKARGEYDYQIESGSLQQLIAELGNRVFKLKR